MLEANEKRVGIIFITSLLLTIFIVLLPMSSFSETSSSKFDHIETPPMPGQVKPGSDQEAEDSDAMPPAVRELDQKIKRETEVLRRGLTGIAPATETKSKSESSPTVSRESRSDAGSRTVETGDSKASSKGTSIRREKVSTGTAPVIVRKPTRPEKSAGTMGKKTLASQKPSRDLPSENRRVGNVDTSVAAQTETKTQTKTEYASRPAGGKVHDLTFFLKRLIIFVIISAVGFLLMRKYVFRT